MKTRDQYIKLLADFNYKRGEAFGIKRIGIFGSVARDEQNYNSDIDIYYEGEPLSLFRMAALKEELEEILEKRVDVVRLRETMNQLLKKRIQKEGFYVR